MALFSICRKLYISRALTRSIKLGYSEFHSLRKLDNFPFTMKNLTPFASPKRNFFWIFKKRTKKEIRALDKLPESYQLIYRNGIDHYFLFGQWSIIIMTVTVTACSIYASQDWIDATKGTYSLNLPYEEPRPQPVNSNELLCFFAAFVLVSCFFFFYMGKTPMRIYYHPQKQIYLFYFYGSLSSQVKKQVVNVGDFQPLPENGISPWNHQHYQHRNGQKLFMFDNYFRNPADLYIMLGWQQDPNIEKYEKENDKKKLL